MEDKPISQFPAASSVNASDVLSGVQEGVTKKFSLAVLFNSLATWLGNMFVPTSRTVNNKDLSANITLDKTDIGLGNVADEAQYSANNPPPYPVTSVNGSTGAVMVSVPSPSDATPQDLGTEAAGSSGDYSRADHVHKKPTAADIGAYVKPSGGIPASDIASGVIPSVPFAYTSNPEMDGTASPGSSVSWAKGDHVHPVDTSRAPKAHASSATTYGKGSASNYGHVKLYDDIDSSLGASDGVAASPKAVKKAYDTLNNHGVFDAGRVTGTTKDVDLSAYQTTGGFALLIFTRGWAAVTNAASIYCVHGSPGTSYTGVSQIIKEPYGATVTKKNNTTITLTWGTSDGGYYSILPVIRKNL